MGGEDRHDLDLTQPLHRRISVDSRLAHSHQRAPERIRLGWSCWVQLGRPPPSLAMVRLGQIGEFEINCEGLRRLVRANQVELLHNLLRPLHQFGSGCAPRVCVFLPLLD